MDSPVRRPPGFVQNSPELSIVIPAYNEHLAIESVVRGWVAYLEDEGFPLFELVVVNDGSKDGTGRILDRLRKETLELRVVHQLRAGYASAIRRGCEAARGRFILLSDSSGRYEPSDLARIWMRRNEAPLVLGYRTHRLDNPILRLLSTVVRRAAKLLFGDSPRDPTIGFRLFRRETVMPHLAELPLSAQGLNLCLPFLLQREFREPWVELGVPYRTRSLGKNHSSLLAKTAVGFQCFYELLRLKISSSRKIPSISILKPTLSHASQLDRFSP